MKCRASGKLRLDKAPPVVGDKVEVFKGRKVPIGYTGTVTKIYDWKDLYGRVQATYVILDYTFKTNINNCRRVEE